MAISRLKKELMSIQKTPVEYITARPLDSNILEWHFVIEGPPDSPYEGGQYHGKLKFPSEYPLKPPAIKMLTPSGRFQTNTRLCLSMSDYHPETWNPMWSVASILTGLLSFMLENGQSIGALNQPVSVKTSLAIASHNFNRENPLFKNLFPELLAMDSVKKNTKSLPESNNSNKPIEINAVGTTLPNGTVKTQPPSPESAPLYSLWPLLGIPFIAVLALLSKQFIIYRMR